MNQNNLKITCKRLPYQNPQGEQTVIMLINISGVLDFGTAPDLRAVLDDCFRQGIYRFIIDLVRLQHMGSSGIGAFIGILDTLEEHKGGLVFIRPNSPVRTTFNLFRLSNFFSITNNTSSALDELWALDK